MVDVAQLVRAPDCGSGGRGFDSHHPPEARRGLFLFNHQIFKIMQNIQMVDLYNQYLRLKDDIDNAINNVIKSTAFIKGKEVALFEEELSKYLNVRNVITCANGTDALMIALMALEIENDAEVIVPDFTFIATAEVVALLGYKLKFVDVDLDTFNINIESLKSAITKKTKVIIPVHLFGQCANMEEIMSIAKDNNIYVIEDCAQSLGSKYFFKNGKTTYAGTIGDIGCTSFFPSKNLGCYGDGGAIFTNNDELAEKIRMITNHGMREKYYHEIIGVNSRLDTLQAAILNVKLKHLDDFNNRRQKAAEYYYKALKDIKEIVLPERVNYSTHVFHQYTIKIINNKRDELKEFLKIKNIPSMVYYPLPLHKQKVFSNLNYKDENLPNSTKLSNIVISLPMHTELTNEQLDYICSNICEFFK